MTDVIEAIEARVSLNHFIDIVARLRHIRTEDQLYFAIRYAAQASKEKYDVLVAS